jgi:hypothetical protein
MIENQRSFFPGSLFLGSSRSEAVMGQSWSLSHFLSSHSPVGTEWLRDGRSGCGSASGLPSLLHILGAVADSIFFILFICAYNAWVISPPSPTPPYHPLRPLPLPPPPQYPAETILPLFLILL